MVFDGYYKEMQYLGDDATKKSTHLELSDSTKLLSVLGTDDPQKLLAALIFHTSYTFAIRYVQELHFHHSN